MKLVYTATGKPVTVGDIVTLRDNVKAKVAYFRPPHSAASSGKVTVQFSKDSLDTREYYVSVINAEWIDRDDR